MSELPLPAALPEQADLSAFFSLFDGEDSSEKDKQTMLQALWSIAVSFARLGWGKTSAQQAIASRHADEPACGQFGTDANDLPVAAPSMVELPHPEMIEQFTSASDLPPQKKKET